MTCLGGRELQVWRMRAFYSHGIEEIRPQKLHLYPRHLTSTPQSVSVDTHEHNSMAYLITHLSRKTILVLLRMPRVGVLLERRAVDGALEVLEADLALHGLCCSVLTSMLGP
jgi:hypothetical protein